MILSTRRALPAELADLRVDAVRHVDEGVRGAEWTELLVHLPVALLATWDLAERAGLLARARALLGLDGVLRLDDGAAVATATLAPEALLDRARADHLARLRPPDSARWEAMIVHASPDRAVARALYDRLVIAGVDVFLDRASVPRGGLWAAWLRAAAERSSVVVVLCSRHTDDAWYVHDEIARAIAGARTGAQRLVVARLDDAPAPYGLAGVQAIDLRALPPRDALAALVAEVVA